MMYDLSIDISDVIQLIAMLAAIIIPLYILYKQNKHQKEQDRLKIMPYLILDDYFLDKNNYSEKSKFITNFTYRFKWDPELLYKFTEIFLLKNIGLGIATNINITNIKFIDEKTPLERINFNSNIMRLNNTEGFLSIEVPCDRAGYLEEGIEISAGYIFNLKIDVEYEDLLANRYHQSFILKFEETTQTSSPKLITKSNRNKNK